MVMRSRLLSAHWLLALLFAPVWIGSARTAASDGGWAAGRSAPVLASAVEAPAQSAPPIFIPLIVAPPKVGIQFGTGVDSQNNLVNPGTAFVYGIARLYYRYAVTGAPGLSYRTEWFVDGARQPLLDDSGPIPAESAVFTNYFCSPTLSSCDQPVPRGAYRVKFYIADLLYSEATAVVQ
jgi:hypothetical protein